LFAILWLESWANQRAPAQNQRQVEDSSLLVNALYKAAFGRLAEPGGLAQRIHQLQSGVSPQVLAEELVRSPEFQARHGSSQKVDAKYITALYRAASDANPNQRDSNIG
jgi:hypothetical protein